VDLAPHGHAIQRAAVHQEEDGPARPVRDHGADPRRSGRPSGIDQEETRAMAFPGRRGRPMTTRQYARLLDHRLADNGPESPLSGRHSLRSTKATLIYLRTGNLRAVQLLLGRAKIECIVCYLGVEVDDALAIAKQVGI
jgi:site-specific recombinase XerD